MTPPEWLTALGLGAVAGFISGTVPNGLLLPHLYRDESGKRRLELGFLANMLVGVAAAGLAWCFSAGADFDSAKISPIRLGEASIAGIIGWPAIKVYRDRNSLSEVKAEATETLDTMSARLLHGTVDTHEPQSQEGGEP